MVSLKEINVCKHGPVCRSPVHIESVTHTESRGVTFIHIKLYLMSALFVPFLWPVVVLKVLSLF